MIDIMQTINYVDYGLIGIIFIMGIVILWMYQNTVLIKYDKEKWKLIAIETEKTRKSAEMFETEVDRRIDKMLDKLGITAEQIQLVRKLNAE